MTVITSCKIQCDRCGSIPNVEFKTYDDSVSFKKKSNWGHSFLNGKWKDFCLDCCLAEESLNKMWEI